MKFEDKIKELQTIVAKLEDKNTPLDDGIRAFENAAAIVEECLSLLETSRGKFTEIQKRLNGLVEKTYEEN